MSKANEISHAEKIEWMHKWAANNGCQLTLEGECGFGRECVGILAGEIYPDYTWGDEETWERIDNNGEVWTPPNAYHKHPCVAVLGRGREAEAQLYEWLNWFDDNGFTLEQGANDTSRMDPIEILLGKGWWARMVKGGSHD